MTIGPFRRQAFESVMGSNNGTLQTVKEHNPEWLRKLIHAVVDEWPRHETTTPRDKDALKTSLYKMTERTAYQLAKNTKWQDTLRMALKIIIDVVVADVWPRGQMPLIQAKDEP